MAIVPARLLLGLGLSRRRQARIARLRHLLLVRRDRYPLEGPYRQVVLTQATVLLQGAPQRRLSQNRHSKWPMLL